MAADEERTVGEKIEARLAAIEEHLGIGNAAEPQETVADTETGAETAADTQAETTAPEAAPAADTQAETTEPAPEAAPAADTTTGGEPAAQ